VAQQPVAPPHRLRVLQVRETWHEDIDLGLGAVARDRDERVQARARLGDLLDEPEAVVCRDLVVA
jgi:hypothetical protein